MGEFKKIGVGTINNYSGKIFIVTFAYTRNRGE